MDLQGPFGLHSATTIEVQAGPFGKMIPRFKVQGKLNWVCIKIGRPPSSTSWKKDSRPVYPLLVEPRIQIHTLPVHGFFMSFSIGHRTTNVAPLRSLLSVASEVPREAHSPAGTVRTPTSSPTLGQVSGRVFASASEPAPFLLTSPVFSGGAAKTVGGLYCVCGFGAHGGFAAIRLHLMCWESRFFEKWRREVSRVLSWTSLRSGS